MPESNEIIISTTNTQMATQLTGIRESLLREAQIRVDKAVSEAEANGEIIPGPEVAALLETEQLQVSTSVDLVALLVKAEIIREMRETRNWESHPNEYQSFQECLLDNGISESELSDILGWADVMFPYFRKMDEELNEIYDPAYLFEVIGKSKLRTITSIAKSLISDSVSSVATVRATVHKYWDMATATLYGNEDGVVPDSIVIDSEDVKMQAVVLLLNEAKTSRTVRELRSRLRPRRERTGNRIAPTQMTANITGEGVVRIEAELSLEQYNHIRRRLGAQWVSEALPIISNSDDEIPF